MNFISLTKDRYSLRKFNDKPVEKEKLELVLKAGQLAPTAGNLQPQRILVIESDAAPNQQMHNHRKPLADTVFYDHF